MTKLSRRDFIKKSTALGTAVATFPIPINAMNLPTENKIKDILTSFGFHGHRLDSSLSIYHTGNGYRCYDPAIRRFMQYDRDMSPFGAAGFNGYSFVMNDPFNQVDPDGRLDISGLVSGIFSVLFVVTTLALTILTGGASSVLAIAALAVSTGAGLVNGAVGIAESIIDDPDNIHSDGLALAGKISAVVMSVADLGRSSSGMLGSGAKKLGLSTSNNTGFASKNFAKQISKSTVFDKVGSVSETVTTIGSTVDLVGHVSDSPDLETAGSWVNFSAKLLGSSSKTIKLSKTKGANGKVDIKKRVNITERSNDFIKTTKRLKSNLEGGDEEIITSKDILSSTKDLDTTSFMIPENTLHNIAARSELVLERHTYYVKKTTKKYSYGLDHLNH
ncbi:RHS repeat-associated core domain-containing protein [Photobacterium minamisatsumaniensis]|uniref:RHS repeat-associated core domain-containing protein n=1 Tax=Photobacterium minamisatsumaniensis TaxID=2910233 RepID=UPI003D10298D